MVKMMESSESMEIKMISSEVAADVFRSYAESLASLSQEIGEEIDRAIELIMKSSGRVILTGIGKSGIIARKIAATLASTGTPSFFVHSAEAFHGDLGMIRPDDVVILISYSGETEEVIKLLPFFKRYNIPTIALVGRKESTLAQHANVKLVASAEREVCPNNLAPTTSSMLALAIGDALAVCLIKQRNFKPLDFAQFHPGGSLGRKLLTTVKEVMIHRDLPIVTSEDSMREVVWTMTRGRLGLALVVDDNLLNGIISDGDLRRALVSGQDFDQVKAKNVMTRNPLTIHQGEVLQTAEILMNEHKVNAVVVVDDTVSVVGVMQIYDRG